MARDVHPETVALIKKHDERLRCTAYMGEGWEREYVAQNAVTEALRQRDDARGSADALRWLERHSNYELSHGYEDEEDSGSWRVHRVNGGVNDLEWTLIGSGPTPLDAIHAAMRALAASA